MFDIAFASNAFEEKKKENNESDGKFSKKFHQTNKEIDY